MNKLKTIVFRSYIIDIKSTIFDVYEILVNTIDAVASFGIVPLGNFPLRRVGSPIRVPLSADQNNKEIRSPTTKLTNTVLDMV